MQNPYQAPSAKLVKPTKSEDGGPNFSMLAGRYFQLLAVISIVSCITVFLTQGIFVPDWSPILTTWIGVMLIRRSKTVRSFVIVICSIFATTSILATLVVVFAGTENLSFCYGSLTLESPSRILAMTLLFIAFTIFAIPVLLLMNAKAATQFGANNPQ